MSPDLFLTALAVAGFIGLLLAFFAAFRRSPALMVAAGFLVIGATSFAVTTIALA